jgi:zinc transport system substrate-binding protein
MNYRRIAILLMTLLLVACGAEPSPETNGPGAGRAKPLIIASNYPLYYFAQAIAGESAEVVLPPMEGDPANWNPTGEDIAQMQSADLVILNGAGYESWLNWVSLPNNRLLDTSAGLRERLIKRQEETIHQHGPGGEHSHLGLAFTLWLDPLLAIEQARVIEQAMSKRVPQNQDAYRARLMELEIRLTALDEALQSALKPLADQPIVFSHPVYQYLAARYGLNGVSMHWEPGEDPGIKAWIDFGETLRSHPAKVMVWEDSPGKEVTDQLEHLDIRPMVFHTASNLPDSGDYFDVMYANIKRLDPE